MPKNVPSNSTSSNTPQSSFNALGAYHRNKQSQEVLVSKPATSTDEADTDEIFRLSETVSIAEDDQSRSQSSGYYSFDQQSRSEYFPDTTDLSMVDAMDTALFSELMGPSISAFPQHTVSWPSDINSEPVPQHNDHALTSWDEVKFDCATIAISVLHQLNTAIIKRPPVGQICDPVDHHFPSDLSTPPAEPAIRTVSAAVKRVSAILICPCSRRTDIGLLAAAVCVALLDALECMLGDARDAAPEQLSSTQPLQRRSTSSLMRDTEALELCTENFGAAVSAKATIRHVLEELPRVANLTTQFSQRYERDVGECVGEMLRSLAASVTARLREIINHVTDLVAQIA